MKCFEVVSVVLKGPSTDHSFEACLISAGQAEQDKAYLRSDW